MSLTGLIGLLAILPAVALLTRYSVAGTDAASIFCFFWILKLGLHAPAMETLGRVISNERATLASILIVFMIVLVIAATATHTFERLEQPKAFGSLPDALWWAVVTLTTTGYGDVVPHTVGGKMIGALVMVSGIAVLALMTGVLATGFAEEERRREYLRVWDQVTKVPIFTELGTVTLSEIVGKLRTRHYPARIVVVRRDEPGDSMFFISEGEVEVRLPHASVKLGQGGFFGEMALLDRLPRSATIVTSQPTTLLVLMPATSTKSPRASRRWSKRSKSRRAAAAPKTTQGQATGWRDDKRYDRATCRGPFAAPCPGSATLAGRRADCSSKDRHRDHHWPGPHLRLYRGASRGRGDLNPPSSESHQMSLITPVILVGGSGKRLWPLSRESMPKQFVPLLGKQSTFQQTLQRVADR